MKSIKTAFTAAVAVNYGLGIFWLLVTVIVLMDDAQRQGKLSPKDKGPAAPQSPAQAKRPTVPRPF